MFLRVPCRRAAYYVVCLLQSGWEVSPYIFCVKCQLYTWINMQVNLELKELFRRGWLSGVWGGVGHCELISGGHRMPLDPSSLVLPASCCQEVCISALTQVPGYHILPLHTQARSNTRKDGRSICLNKSSLPCFPGHCHGDKFADTAFHPALCRNDLPHLQLGGEQYHVAIL